MSITSLKIVKNLNVCVTLNIPSILLLINSLFYSKISYQNVSLTWENSLIDYSNTFYWNVNLSLKWYGWLNLICTFVKSHPDAFHLVMKSSYSIQAFYF